MVLGAELGRRLKKKSQRQRSLSRKQLSLKTLGAQCPRPDPAGRSAALVPRLPPCWGRQRGKNPAPPLRGRPEGAAGFPAPRCWPLCGSPENPIRQGFGRRGAGFIREGNIWWGGGGSWAREAVPQRLHSRLPGPRR